MKTRRFLALLLTAAMLFTLAACREKNDNTLDVSGDVIEDVVDAPETEGEGELEAEATPEAVKPSEKPVSDPPAKKPAASEKPSAAPSTAPSIAPSDEPTQTPESTPSATPTPEQKPQTVGKTLLADFNAKASSASSSSALAEAIVANPIIPFMAVTMPVEQGLLSGFGNTEITGFSEATMFGPMVGSVPFIGYVFVLEEGTNKSDFISTLKSNADLRWNICVEADEMVAGSSGNKVFFVMCPKEFSEE